MTIMVKGIKRFQQAGNKVLEKISELRDCKTDVLETIVELSIHAKNLTSVLERLDKSVEKLEKRKKFLQTSGVAATTIGSSLAAVLWAIAYVNEEEDGYCTPLAWVATGVGIGGTVVKMSTAYICARSNQGYMKELEESMTSNHGKNVNSAEVTLKAKYKEMIELLKQLYGNETETREKDNTAVVGKIEVSSDYHPLLHHRNSTKVATERKQSVEIGDESAPLVISLMETADSASCAPDVISTVFEYSSDFGLESMDVLEQTYDAATSSLGEVISFGILEGAANGLSLVISSYEIYRLVGSWNKENPTSQKIEELISNIKKKIKVYNNLKKCIETVDTFTKLRSFKRSG